MLQAKLKVLGGRHHGKMIALATKKFLIGREQDCHLRPNSELVSRHHCVFAVDDFSVRVRDLGSTNGTFLNDHRVRGEEVLKSGDRIRVGKLDLELVIGDAAASSQGNGDSSQALAAPVDASISETSPLAASDTSFEIPVPAGIPEDTGSSILPTESLTPVPTGAGPAPGDSTVVWSPPSGPGFAPDPYAPMGMPYPQAPYQPPMYPYMPPGMGYQQPFAYPQMPMHYPGMYPPQMVGYPPPAPAPMYAPPQPAATPAPEPEEDEAVSIPTVRLPDPKTTGAKSAAPPPPPTPAAAAPTPPPAAPGNEMGGEMKNEEAKPAAPPVKPSEGAADILKKYTQRRPV
jgi:predicted component of type VI protein secretion system